MRHDDDIDRWEGDEDEEEDDHRRRNVRTRGMGRRDHIGRGKRRGGRGGSVVPRKRKRDDHENVCIFYMHGKCHRGSDCPYSHDAHPPRKMELCKFYMMDCCAKKDKCLYMHNDFPCKYYHTGLKCYAGKNCKFSHGKLNDTLRTILLKRFCPQHLETAPKEILGEFPRMTREGAMTMMHVRNEKKIPSLFDIKVPKPATLCNNSNSDGNHTPMPSPTHQSQDSKNSDRERTPDKEERKEERKERRSKEKQDRRKEKRRGRRREEKRKERGKEKDKERSKERRHSADEQENKKLLPVLPEELPKDEEKEKHDEDRVKEEEKEQEKEKEIEHVIGPSLTAEESIETVPAHLPKKQRELFLRIQQQQREANSSQTSGEDDDHDDGDTRAEENWYSSDEDASPPSTLPSILRNLTQSTNSSLPTATSSAPLPISSTSLASSTSVLPPMISNIDFSTVLKVLSSFKNIDQKNEEQTNINNVVCEESSSKQSNPPEDSTTAKKVDVFSLLNSAKKSDPSSFVNTNIPKKLEPPRVRDPRLRNDPGGGGETSLPTAPSGDIDLRLKTNLSRGIGGGDVDLRNLPFKPAPVHSAANEIDASLSSHSPIPYRLIPVEVAKTDYASLQGLAKPGINDPRLRRVIRVGTDETSCRDPRQRLGIMDEIARPKPMTTPLVADPRQRAHLLPQSMSSVLPTPSTPRYDEDHRTSYFCVDSDMRQFPPPTPRIDDDYIPNTIRTNDPRQRNSALGFDTDPRRSTYQPHHYNSDTDLRPQLGLQQPQYNIK